MHDNSLVAFILVVLVISVLWRQLLPLLLAFIVAAFVIGLAEIIHFLRL